MTAAGMRIAGRYRLGASVGAGGMGRVWLAYDEVLRREVAIKQIVLPFGLAEDDREELHLRTLREARAAARLSHPNIVRIYDVIQGEDQPWIVMEYVAARSLLQVLDDGGPLPADQVARIGLAMLSALAAANRAGVLHRDVKPGNVLIADDRVVLTDFGSAILDDIEGAITRTGLILGSPHYMAPERIREGICTPESDLWSLGATLYTAAEGHAPFTRPTVAATLIAVTTERPDPIQRATILRPVLTGLLKRNPKARMSASETERRLRQIAGLASTVTRPSPAPAAREATPPPRPTADIAPPEAPTAVPPPLPAALADEAEPGAGPVFAPPAVAPTRRSARLRGAVVAVLTAAVVLALGGVVLATHPLHPPRHSPAASDTAANGSAAGTRAGTADAHRAGNNVASMPRPPLPADLTWWYDQSGFVVPVPIGWKARREGPQAMYFCQPGGPRTLRVHAWNQLDSDPVIAMTREEARAKLGNYHRVRIEALREGHGAEWEYTFTDQTGDLHGLERGLVVAGHAYLIQWRAPEATWQAGLADYAAIVDGFQPVAVTPGPGPTRTAVPGRVAVGSCTPGRP